MTLPNTEELLQGIRRWVELETHTPDADQLNKMMDMVTQEVEAFGATTERFPGQNGRGDHLLATAPWGDPEAPYILLLSHLDTVHPKGTIKDGLPFKIDGDKVYGPGIYDMKAGAYFAMQAVKSIAEETRERGSPNSLPVRHLFTADEEVGSQTSRAIIQRLAENAKYVLVTEPARDGGQIVTARKGTARFTLKIEGRPAHSGSRHHDGRSAIKELAHQILLLEGLTDYDRKVTINVGQISGGTGTNVVPQFAQAEIDLRVPTQAAAEEFCAKILNLTPKDPDCKLSITGGMNRPPFAKTPEIENLFQHARALASELGIDLQQQTAGGGSDGNFIADKVPTLDGLGADGEGAHTLNEHIYASALVPRMNLMKGLLKTLS